MTMMMMMMMVMMMMMTMMMMMLMTWARSPYFTVRSVWPGQRGFII